ncbi:MAG: multicopper oxidase domain-containing protein [Bacteroidetes bacterium]|nr:multicopper oxidase domain-containing protein [Bacteroidota bacterium]
MPALGNFFGGLLAEILNVSDLVAHEKGWKDTVLVMPKETVRILVRFQQPGKFVFHCHNLEHEDDGMMLNYEVK